MTAPPPVRTLADLRGRRAVVLGLARSGIAAARALTDAGATVTVYDRRSSEELADAIAALEGRRVRLALGVGRDEVRALLAAADLVVTSPSVSPHFPTTDPWLREALLATERRGVEVLSEVELGMRLLPGPVVAITGTKGKTTTTAMLGAVLERAGWPHLVGGNIGAPIVDRVAGLEPERIAVLELSELQLPTLSRGADLAVYTNIGADHLDRHGSVDAYRAVKARLAELSIAHGGTVVLNADDPGCRELAARLPAAASLAWYGLERGDLRATLRDGRVVVDGGEIMAVDEVPLPGRHMLANVLAVALAARLLGVERAAIADGVRGFAGVPHRLELVATLDGVRFVNDSQATIPMAAIAALHAFDTAVVLVAGGQDKGLAYDELGDAIAARCRAVVLIGETAAAIEAAVGGRVRVERAATMDEAVDRARGLATAGDVVLLAPASASFDMFVDYAARGEAFRAAVLRGAAT